MKKLLAMVLVLGMASVASAALVGSADVTAGAVTWSIAGDQLIGTGTAIGRYDGAIQILGGAGSVTADPTAGYKPGVENAAGNLGTATPNAAGYTLVAGVLGDPTLNPPDQALGQWFTFDLAGIDGADPLTLRFYYTGQFTQATPDMEITPEPITMSLLGLGGVALLRRRRA
jgi:hypothetical protein